MPNKRRTDEFCKVIQDLHVIPTLVRWECGCVGFRVPGYQNSRGFPLGIVMDSCTRDDDPVYPEIRDVGKVDNGQPQEKDWETLNDSGMHHLLRMLNRQGGDVVVGQLAKRMIYLTKIQEED